MPAQNVAQRCPIPACSKHFDGFSFLALHIRESPDQAHGALVRCPVAACERYLDDLKATIDHINNTPDTSHRILDFPICPGCSQEFQLSGLRQHVARSEDGLHAGLQEMDIYQVLFRMSRDISVTGDDDHRTDVSADAVDPHPQTISMVPATWTAQASLGAPVSAPLPQSVQLVVSPTVPAMPTTRPASNNSVVNPPVSAPNPQAVQHVVSPTIPATPTTRHKSTSSAVNAPISAPLPQVVQHVVSPTAPVTPTTRPTSTNSVVNAPVSAPPPQAMQPVVSPTFPHEPTIRLVSTNSVTNNPARLPPSNRGQAGFAQVFTGTQGFGSAQQVLPPTFDHGCHARPVGLSLSNASVVNSAHEYGRLCGSQGAPVPEAQRCNLLVVAHSRSDLFFMALHQVICVQSITGNRYPLGDRIPSSTIGLLNHILDLRGQIRPFFMQAWSEFPRPINILMQDAAYRPWVLDIMNFLLTLPQAYGQLLENCVARGFPPLSSEIYRYLRLGSRTMQDLFFTAILWRIWRFASNADIEKAYTVFRIDYNHYANFGAGQSVPPTQVSNDMLRLQYQSIYTPRTSTHSSTSLHGQRVMNSAPTINNVPVEAPPSATPVFPNSPRPNASRGRPRGRPPGRASIGAQTSTHVVPNNPVLNTSKGRPRGRPPGRASSCTQTFRQMAFPSGTLPSRGEQMTFPPPNHAAHALYGRSQYTQQHGAVAQPPHPEMMRHDARRPPVPNNANYFNLNAQRPEPGLDLNRLISPREGDEISELHPPDPDRTALHLAHLKSPVLKRKIMSSPEPGPMYRYVSDFLLPPKALDSSIPSQLYHFDISDELWMSLATEQPRPDSNCTNLFEVGAPTVRFIKEGTQSLRLRCNAGPVPLSSDINAWTIGDTAWPSDFYFSINDHHLEERRKLQFGRNLPTDITAHLRPGANKLEIFCLSACASNPEDKVNTPPHCVAIESILASSHETVTNAIHARTTQPSTTLAAIKTALNPTDDDIACLTSTIPIRLFDPILATIWTTPVRSATCRHREAFDLLTFLQTRPLTKPADADATSTTTDGAPNEARFSKVDVWECPLCGADARPDVLVVDGWLVELRVELEKQGLLESARVVDVDEEGRWAVKTEEKSAAGRNGGVGGDGTPVARKVPEVIMLDDD